ncbi:aldehyde reductase [Lepidopterella palustris CBS 459.81]|uniref:Aldehyde reductase n=1 Tax=Lepidopterella palustris CBS 459.81 TaxID=1314670 RepID=A0A8E2E3Q2_9PEZI|nr:aldehyde reductase [Lepidopterella palustris CBS 459.81]
MSCIKIVVGGAAFNSSFGAFPDVSTVQKALHLLKDLGVKNIDAAKAYGDCEELLGGAGAGNDFIIDTKVPGGLQPGSATKANIIADVTASLQKLKVDKVDVLYIHAPDPSIPLSETLAGINEVYEMGLFARFGLSNYTPEDVEKVYELCKAHGYVLPSVYQGNYSAVARKPEDVLFPVLRRLGIAFYAYSPLAGGFLTKSKEQVLEGAGRFGDSPFATLYNALYSKPSYLDVLAEWNAIAVMEGCSKAELAYRWVAYNSPLKEEFGDALIFGGNSMAQLEGTVKGLKEGPLSKEACKRIEGVWKRIEHEAPMDNYQTMLELGK